MQSSKQYLSLQNVRCVYYNQRRRSVGVGKFVNRSDRSVNRVCIYRQNDKLDVGHTTEADGFINAF